MVVPELEIVISNSTGEVLRRTVRPGEYVIGSADTADLCVALPEIAGRHALLTVNYDHTLIETLDGSPPVLINGQPIGACTRLWPNQKVQVGAATVSLRRKKTAAEPDTTLAPASEALRRLLPEEFLREQKYAIGGVVAQGGMGAILDAREATTGRTVAMKVMLDGSSPDDLTRFIAEARATAQLEHPNIVPVHELSVDENEQVFYTMKFVRGVTLRQVLEQLAAGDAATVRAFPLATLLTIFQKACDAVAFAHSRSVLHRDLKPENIMVGEYGEVLVMDWGLAKDLGGKPEGGGRRAEENAAVQSSDFRPPPSDFSSATLAGTIMGTPAYMSPEQARGEVEALDVRSDLYALGSILFHILHLRAPFTGSSGAEIVDKVARGEVEWASPSSSSSEPTTRTKENKNPPPDSLAAVVRQALAFDRDQRYWSVPELQADLTAYQAGFATAAEHAGPWKQAVLFVRRHRAVSTAVAAALVLLAAVSAGFTARVIRERNRAETGETAARQHAAEATAQRTRAVAALAQSEETLLQMQYRKALEALDRDEPAEALAWLAAILCQRPEHPSAGPLIVSTLSERSFPLPVGAPIYAGTGQQADLQFLPNGQLLTRTDDAIALWDFSTGRLLQKFRGSGRVTFTPDGRFLLIGSAPEWESKKSRDAVVEVIEIAGGRTVATLEHDHIITALAATPDSTRLATGSREGVLKIWRVPEFTLERTEKTAPEVVDFAERLHWSHDGQWLAASRRTWRAQVWNTVTGAVGMPFGKANLVCFAPASDRAVIGAFQIADAAGNLLVAPTQNFPPSPIRSPAIFAPTERRLAAIPENRNEIRLFETSTGGEWFPPLAFSGRPVSAAFSPEGSRLLGVAEDGTARLWDAVLGQRAGETFVKKGAGSWRPALAPDGAHVALPTSTGTVERWTVEDGRALGTRLRPVTMLDLFKANPAATKALAIDHSSSPRLPHRLVDLATGGSLEIPMPSQRAGADPDAAAFAADGSKVAITGQRGGVAVWDTANGTRLSPGIALQIANMAVAFSPDGQRLAVVGVSSGGVVVDWQTGQRICELDKSARGTAVRWSPDGARLFIKTFSGLNCYDATSGRELWYAGQAASFAVRSDFIQLASATDDGLVSFRSMASGEKEGPPLPHEQTVSTMAYSPDGTVLATGSRDQAARLWSVATGKMIGEAMRHEGAVARVVFSPDGRRLATATDTGTVRLWDVATTQPLSLTLPHPLTKDVFYTGDGRRLVVAAGDGTIYFHDVPPLPQPAPAWLAELAEAVAQRRVDDAGQTSRSGVADVATLRAHLAGAAGDDDYTRWVRWFFADRATRTATAFSAVPMSAATDQLVTLGSLAELEEARRRRPTDPKIMALLAKKYREKSEPTATAHADFLDALAAWNTTTGAASRILEAQQQMRAAAARLASLRPLDLTAHFNNDLKTSLGKADSPWNLAALPRGLQSFDDVSFDVNGMLVVRGTGADGSRPEQISGIAVRRKARVLHLLQGANYFSPGGTRIGSYVLHYADGEKRELPIVYGEDTRDWNVDDANAGQPIKNATVAWTGAGGSTHLQLFHRAYENPRPDVEIATLDFVSASATATPFVVAITLE